MSHARTHPNWTPIHGERDEAREENCVTRLTLFVGHGEDAFPAALAIELMGLTEEVEAVANFVWSAIDGALRGKADEFEDGYRLELAFHANEIEFAEDEAVVLDGGVRGFVDQDM